VWFSLLLKAALVLAGKKRARRLAMVGALGAWRLTRSAGVRAAYARVAKLASDLRPRRARRRAIRSAARRLKGMMRM
jgi:hypothetical protein